jgi:hypothetical protein
MLVQRDQCIFDRSRPGCDAENPDEMFQNNAPQHVPEQCSGTMF